MKKIFSPLLLAIAIEISPAVAQIYTDEVNVVPNLQGQVGIGVSPTRPLHLLTDKQNMAEFKSSQLDSKLIITSTASLSGTFGPGILIQRTSASHGWRLESMGTTDAPGDNFAISRSNYPWTRFFVIQKETGNVGIGTASPSQKLSVNGDASKSTAGSWSANSDARLKTNITPLSANETLEKLLQLQGLTYQWADTVTGITRPEGIHYGFTAQNIQKVFPELVTEDNLGYLQTAYGTYDAMLIEALRALNEKIGRLEEENKTLFGENKELKEASASHAESDQRLQASIILMQQQLQELTQLVGNMTAKENIEYKSVQQ